MEATHSAGLIKGLRQAEIADMQTGSPDPSQEPKGGKRIPEMFASTTETARGSWKSAVIGFTVCY
jgi:hypothetical protein